MNRFPTSVKLTIRGPVSGSFHWELRMRGGCSGRPGQFLADGVADTSADARADAWNACEQCGLVVDR